MLSLHPAKSPLRVFELGSPEPPRRTQPIKMRLVPCSPPSEPLDAAPRTALLLDLEPGTDMEGFWSSSTDAYFTRCTTREGAVHWYRISDDSPSSLIRYQWIAPAVVVQRV